MKLQKPALIAIGILGILVVFAAGFLFGKSAQAPRVEEAPPSQGVACTDDARLCPDGSAVGREGPSCEFPDCPSESPSVRP